MSSGSPKRRSSRRRSTPATDPGASPSGDSSQDPFGNEGGGEDFGAATERDMAALINMRIGDDETETETIDPATQALLDELDAISRGDFLPPQPETFVPEGPQDTEETGELAMNKRELLTELDLEFDFSTFFDFRALLGVPASTVKLVLHPRFKASLDASTPIYLQNDDGGLGDAEEIPLTYATATISYEIGRPVLVRDAQGMPMVACSGVYGGDYLIGRDALVEETYQTTVSAIDANDAKYDKELLAFWRRLLEPLDDLTEVTLPFQLLAIPKTAVDQRRVRHAQPVTVPQGTYQKVGLVERRIEAEQLSPFSLVIKVEEQELVVAPETIINNLLTSEKADASEENPLRTVEAPPQVAEALQVVPEPGRVRAAQLTAEQIVAFFTGSDAFGRYMNPPQRSDWLRDEHVHYVTEDQLGALLVLNRPPESPEEIETARANDQFAMSKTSNGTHIDGHIYIREDRTGAGTEYHETVHKLSHPAVLQVFGFFFNEGLTEHFTQLLMQGGELVRDKDQYGHQQQAIAALMKYAGVTEDELARAYFWGELQPLYDRVANVGVFPPFSPDSPFSLDGYAARIDDKHSFAARQTLMIACGFDGSSDDDDTTTTATTSATDDTTATTTANDTDHGDDR